MSTTPSPQSPAHGASKFIGRFVRRKRGGPGVGKVAEIGERRIVVEYFESIGRRTREEAEPSELSFVRLQPQTRCYLVTGDGPRWEAGRVGEYDERDGTYEVTLPGQRAGYVPEPLVYVRCDRPVEDPTDTLVLKGHETPFFHDRRGAFVRALIEQRRAARGLTGLVSSSIDLHAHQAEVARRVLDDPVQRYLLADEVGLGKTVEAGVILRQYLLDEDEGRAVVLVPRFLLEQWRRELEEKFRASDFEERVVLKSVEEAGRIDTDQWIGMLVVDEAHHVAAGAYSADPAARRLYEDCRRLAHRSGRLLLLSATPVLNNERDFLAMLHLLDPQTYGLNDLDAFRERVRARQDVGRILLSFKEDAHPFVLRTSLRNLRQVFPGDARLQGLLDELEGALQKADADPAERTAAVRSVRTHVSDTYRLHRRMLRNRRESVLLAGRMDSARAALDLKVEYDLDGRAAEVHDRLDEWRVRAVDELSADGEGGARESAYREIFLAMLRASGSWFGLLQKVIEARLRGAADPLLGAEFGTAAARAVTETPKFGGEDELLRAVLNILGAPAEDGDRIDVLQAALARLRGAGSKVVVFTSFSSAARELARRLTRAFGPQAVASHLSGSDREDVEEDVERFRDDPACSVLVCDSSGEEGRNLQFADWVVHFDIPWSPNRLEQRIGRLDRIGRNRAVRTRVFLGPDTDDTLHDAWYDLLKNGFRVFERSIASLQFYIEEKMPELLATLFRAGAHGLARSVDAVRSEIEVELVKISEQNALDEIDALEKNVTRYFEDLKAHDGQHEGIKRATEGYALDALMFGWTREPAEADVISYSYVKKKTLVSPSEVLDFFAYSLKQPGTYRRSLAVRRADVSLYRIGHDFIEALADYVRRDDRGQAFAMWRQDPSWDAAEGAEWHGFRFDYVVEARLDEATAVLAEQGMEGAGARALRRRADDLFPPFVRTVYVDHRMRDVTDPQLLRILARPYSKHPNPGRDYNLDYTRAAVIDSLVGEDLWADLCRAARARSEESLRESESFRRECETRARSAERQLGVRVEQLRMRADRAAEGGVPDPTLAQDLEVEEALGRAVAGGIREPSVRLDSLGYVVVSGRAPSGPAGGKD